MANVLVMDSNSRKALCVVRSLGKQGYKVTAVSDKRIDMSRASKYCTDFKRVPDSIKHEKAYLKAILEVISEKQIDVIIPMEDETVELIIKNKELFSNAESLLPDYDTFMIARDKAKTMKYAYESNVSCPKTYELNDIEELIDISCEIEYPVIIKPRVSSGSRGLIHVENSKELLTEYNEVHKTYPLPIIQQYIDGDYKKIQVLVINNKKHDVIAACTYQGIREFPVDGGPVTMWKTTSLPEIEAATYNLLESIKWVGFAEVEYMYNPVTGEYFLIEINPRYSANIALAVNVGVDFPLYLTQLAMNENVEGKFNTKIESYCQWLIPGDILNFAFNKSRFNQEIGYFFKKPKGLTYAIISKKDFLPVINNVLSLFINIFTNLKDLLTKLKSSRR